MKSKEQLVDMMEMTVWEELPLEVLSVIEAVLAGRGITYTSELLETHICSPLYEAMHGSNTPVDVWEHRIVWRETKERGTGKEGEDGNISGPLEG